MIKIAFYTNEIKFDDISCTAYGLKVFAEDGSSKITISNYKSDIVKSYKQSKFLPKKQYIDEPNYITISLYPIDGEPLTRTEIDVIEQWLYRKDGKFRKLTIEQDDMIGLHYNCRLQNIEAETFGNLIYKIHVIFECDSIYAWEDEIGLNFTDFINPIVFDNTTSEDMMCPIYKIYMDATGGTAKIVDSFYTDINENTMEFTGLQANEVITIDTQLCILSSNLRTNILSTFVYPNFLRLDKGEHSFTITGNVTKFVIIYSNARKIGG